MKIYMVSLLHRATIKYIHGGGATQPTAGLKPKASAQMYGTIHATSVFGATIYKTVRHMLSDHCPVCLSVTLVYCGQTVGWIKTKLGTEVGLSRPHCVRWGLALPQRGAVPQFSALVYCGQKVAHLSCC